jgi:GT2 family glycosyltransferase
MTTASNAALIFLNWRTPELTVAAARSALATAPRPEALRFILVDNASGDHSLAYFARELPQAEIVAMTENVGFARAMNAALARVTEPYAFLLNSDIEFKPGALERLLAALESDPKAAMVCPRLLRPDGSEQAAVVPEPRIFWELTNRSLPRHLMRIPRGAAAAVPSVVGPCMGVRMEAVRPLGFLDDRFFFFFEETDLCRRLNRAGWRILYEPAAEVVHMQGESANRRPVRARVQFYTSRYRYFRKHAGAPAVALLFAGMWLRLTLDLLLLPLAVLLTLGRRRKLRDKLYTQWRLWLWHARFCRPAWGFEPPGWLSGRR